MSPEQEQHLEQIKSLFSSLIEVKYRRGQAEHGGDLKNRNCLAEAIQETVDLATYLLTEEEKKLTAKANLLVLSARLKGEQWESERVLIANTIVLLS